MSGLSECSRNLVIVETGVIERFRGTQEKLALAESFRSLDIENHQRVRFDFTESSCCSTKAQEWVIALAS